MTERTSRFANYRMFLSLAKRPDYLFTDDGFDAAEDDVLLLVIAFGFVDRNAKVLVLLMGKQSLCTAEHHGNAAVGEGVVRFRLSSARLHTAVCVWNFLP